MLDEHFEDPEMVALRENANADCFKNLDIPVVVPITKWERDWLYLLRGMKKRQTSLFYILSCLRSNLPANIKTKN